MTKNRPRSGSSASSRRDSSSRSTHVLEHVGADDGARLGGLQLGEVGIVEDVTDEVDTLGGLEVAVDDAHSARLQGTEHQLVDVGLLDLPEVPRGGAEVEKRRQLLRAEPGQRAAEPFGIAAHHVDLLAVAAGTAMDPARAACGSGCPLTVSRAGGNMRPAVAPQPLQIRAHARFR